MTAGHPDVVPGADGPWDGEPGWPRPRHVPPSRPGGPLLPATYVQSDPADPTSADPTRMQQVYLEFRCQVCSARVLDIDTVGWVLTPAANMGGACCTRCMYLAFHACPHLADAPDDAWQIWAVTDPRAYSWQVVDGRTDGHVVLVDDALGSRFDWARFVAHYVEWRRERSRGDDIPERSPGGARNGNR